MITAHAMAAETPKADLYVAPGGNDGNPGTAEAPLASPAKARDLLRQRIAGGLKADLCVLFRGGTYRLDQPLVFGPEDSGTEAHSITYAAWPGEQVVLSGGRTITGWHTGAGGIWTAELPDVKAGKWHFRQLFVNGRRAVRARTPNLDDKSPWWKIRTSTAKPGAADQDETAIVVSVDHPIEAWNNAADVELIYLNNNDGSRKRVGSINRAEQTFILPPPHQWPPKVLPGEYQIGHPLPPYACYFENALELLDQPGEWYLDRQTGILSYWPRAGEDLSSAEVVAPAVQNALLAVRGTPDQPVRNLRFSGIHVEHVDWPLPPHGFTAMFGCLQVASAGGKPPIKFAWIDAAVSFRHTRNCNFTDGGIAHVGGIGLSLLNGCSRNVVEGNHIYDLGGGGITAGGLRNRDTLQWADPLAPDDHAGHRIANNHIHHCGLDYFGAVGVFLALAQDSVVAHNLIHDISYIGIVISGNESAKLPFARNNTVEFNHIHDVMQVAADGGGIYPSFPQADRGAVIRGNLIHDVKHNPFARGSPSNGFFLDGVRPDLGCGNYQFADNVIYGIQEQPVRLYQCKAQDNVWLDNIFTNGLPPRELLEAVQALAGLEPAYRRKLLGEDQLAGHFQALTEPSGAHDVWSAWQFHRPHGDDGLVQAFRRAESNAETAAFKLRGLDETGTYDLRALVGTFDKSTPPLMSKAASQPSPDAGPLPLNKDGQLRLSGRELMEQGVSVRLAQRPGVAWVIYRRVGPTAP